VTRRFYLEPGEFDDGEVRLGGARARRLVNVLRLRAGAELRVFDGLGGERVALVQDSGRASATLTLGEAVQPLEEPPVAVTLVCAFPRGARGDWIVEKTTELGVARIVPLRAQRSVLAPGDSRLARWRRVAVEAAEQCGRAVVPEIGGEPPGGALELVAAAAGVAGISQALDGVTAAAVVLYVGPEGDWSDQELEAHRAAGRIAVSLGPRTLRVETAAVIGAAQVLEATGGLMAPPRPRPTA